MNGTSDFLSAIGKLRNNILGNGVLVNDFMSQPVAALTSRAKRCNARYRR